MLISAITTDQVLQITQTVADVINSFKVPILLLSGIYIGLYILQYIVVVITGQTDERLPFGGDKKVMDAARSIHHDLYDDGDNE